MRITMKQLRGLGVAWPDGPESLEERDDEPFDPSSYATGCESRYHDSKGDPRYLAQKEGFEELAARLRDLPITRRHLAALGFAWPWAYPESDDAPIDIVLAANDLHCVDLHDYQGRPGVLDGEIARVREIARTLRSWGIGRIDAPDQGRPAVDETK